MIIINIGKIEAIHIRGMDAETTREQLLEAIKLAIGKWDKDNMKLSELRPQNNEMMATTSHYQ